MQSFDCLLRIGYAYHDELMPFIHSFIFLFLKSLLHRNALTCYRIQPMHYTKFNLLHRSHDTSTHTHTVIMKTPKKK